MAQQTKYNDTVGSVSRETVRGVKLLKPEQKKYFSRIVEKPQTIYSNNSDINTVAYYQWSSNADSQSFYNSINHLFYKPNYYRITDKYGYFITSSYNGSGSMYPYTDKTAITNRQFGMGPQHKNKFHEKGVLLDISSSLVGDGIKPGTFVMEDNSNGTANKIYIKDDKYGNLYASGSNYQLSQSNNSVSSSDNYIGNIFYDTGLVVIADTGSYKTNHFWTGSGIADKTNYTASFNMTRTIRTLTWTCVLDSNEFNWSQNPTLRETGSWHIRKHGPDSRKYSPFITGSHHENLFNTSFSIVESTASIATKFRDRNFQPYITKIGLYNKDYELICVAALPQPIKKLDNQRMIFEIQMDF